MPDNDIILLKHVIPDEYCPRYYEMSGGTFESMLAVIKTLPFRKFEERTVESGLYPRKQWIVRGEGLKALRELGYTITQESDIRIDMRDLEIRDHCYCDETSKSWKDNPYVTVSICIREKSGQWTLAGVSPFNCYAVPIPHDDELITQVCAELDELSRAAAEKYSTKFIAAKPHDAYRHIGLGLLREHEQHIQQIFTEACAGSRSPEAFIAGAEAVMRFIDSFTASLPVHL
jgi:hypothetical protein